MNEERRRSPFGNNTRFFILFISTACLTLILGNSLALNFTIICMGPTEKEQNESNRTDLKYAYSASQKSWLFSATAIGTIIGVVPIAFLARRFGMKFTLVAYGTISAISTMLVPLAANVGYFALFAMRVLEGLAQGITFPAFPAIAAEWSPIQNSGLYVAVLTCHLQLGPLVMMPLAGEMCSSSLGWPALYYLMGGMTAIAITILFFFHEDYPRDHRWVSKKELALIELGKESTKSSSGEKPSVPYKSIFTDVVVWGILIEYYGGMIALLIFLLFGPVYLHDVLGLEVSNTGFIAALPYLISVFVKFSAGPLSDALNCISQKARVKIFGALSQFTMAGCFVALALLPKEENIWIQVFFTGASVLNALNTVGVDKSCQLTCCQYGYVVQTVVTLSNAVITLLIPLLVGLMAPDNTVHEWSHIFWMIAGIVIVAEVVFVLTAEADPRQWTSTTYNKGQIAPVEYEAKRVSVSLRTPFAEPHENYESTQERL